VPGASVDPVADLPSGSVRVTSRRKSAASPSRLRVLVQSGTTVTTTRCPVVEVVTTRAEEARMPAPSTPRTEYVEPRGAGATS